MPDAHAGMGRGRYQGKIRFGSLGREKFMRVRRKKRVSKILIGSDKIFSPISYKGKSMDYVFSDNNLSIFKFRNQK